MHQEHILRWEDILEDRASNLTDGGLSCDIVIAGCIGAAKLGIPVWLSLNSCDLEDQNVLLIGN